MREDRCLPYEHSMARHGGKVNPPNHQRCLCDLKPPTGEVSIAEDLTIHEFEHTKLIGHHVTLSINTVAVDVCCRTIIAAQEQTIILDGLHQQPQTNQVRVTIKLIHTLIGDLLARTNLCVELFLQFGKLLTLNELTGSRHLAGEVADLLNISEGFLIVSDECIRFHELDVLGIIPDGTVRVCHSVTNVALSIIASVRCHDDSLAHNLRKLISDRVRSVLIRTTESDEVSLIDCLSAGKILQAGTQNLNQTCVSCFIIESEHVLLSVANLDLFLVEYTFGSHEELTVLRIRAPNNSGSTINLDTQSARIHEPIQNGKISRQDGVFGVLKVGVFHTAIVRGQGGVWGEPCASSPSVTLCQNHPIHKVALIKHGGTSGIPDELVDEPLKVLLEYTFALNPVNLKNSIQAGFGGARLPPTIKQLDRM